MSSLGFLNAAPSASDWIEELSALKVKAEYYKANHKITGGRFLPESAIIEHTSFNSLASAEGTNYRVNILFYNDDQIIPGTEKPLSKYIEEENSQTNPKYFLLIQKKDPSSLKVKRVILCPLTLATTLISEKIEKVQGAKLSALSDIAVYEILEEVILKLDEMKLLEMGPKAPNKKTAISIYPHGPLYPLER